MNTESSHWSEDVLLVQWNFAHANIWPFANYFSWLLNFANDFPLIYVRQSWVSLLKSNLQDIYVPKLGKNNLQMSSKSLKLRKINVRQDDLWMIDSTDEKSFSTFNTNCRSQQLYFNKTSEGDVISSVTRSAAFIKILKTCPQNTQSTRQLTFFIPLTPRRELGQRS